MRIGAQFRSLSKRFDGYRNVAAVVASLTIMQAAVGALAIVGPLALSARDASSVAIGLIYAGFAAGFLSGALIAPRQIGNVGHIRAFALFAATAALAGAALYTRAEIAWWGVAQFAIGASIAGLLATGESWVTDSAPPERRGAILGFYLVASKIGLMAGPFLVMFAEPGQASGFMIVAALFTAALLPVLATRQTQPDVSTVEAFGPRKLWRTAPAAVVAAVIAGIVNGSVMQLYALYAAQLNPSAPGSAAALFNLAMMIGVLIAQWPAGLISDHYDRRIVIGALAGISAAASVGLVIAGTLGAYGLIWVLAVIWGAGGLSFYGVTVAHAADRAEPGQATGMMAGILMMWGVGSLAGPLMAGAAMASPLGSSGLFALSAVGLTVLTVAMVYRRTQQSPVRREDKEAFAPSSATSLVGAEINPMGEDAQPDLFDPHRPSPPVRFDSTAVEIDHQDAGASPISPSSDAPANPKPEMEPV